MSLRLPRRELQLWVESGESEHLPERDAERVRFLFIDRSDIEVIRRQSLLPAKLSVPVRALA